MRKGTVFMIAAVVIAAGIFAAGCKNTGTAAVKVDVREVETLKEGFKTITMEEAKGIFGLDGTFIILDVRRADEFAQGHIPGAINLANEEIKDVEPKELTDKEQTIYVYCRSGRRSREAAGKLAKLGYLNIVDCGGILDWTGELEAF